MCRPRWTSSEGFLRTCSGAARGQPRRNGKANVGDGDAEEDAHVSVSVRVRVCV